MGMADIAVALWKNHLRHNPTNNPKWIGRDRFLLSNGHGSMLQYGLLHLSGYDLSLDDLLKFPSAAQQNTGTSGSWCNSRCGDFHRPIGTGNCKRCRFCFSRKMLAAEFNRPGFDVIDNYTYAFLSETDA